MPLLGWPGILGRIAAAPPPPASASSSSSSSSVGRGNKMNRRRTRTPAPGGANDGDDEDDDEDAVDLEGGGRRQKSEMDDNKTNTNSQVSPSNSASSSSSSSSSSSPAASSHQLSWKQRRRRLLDQNAAFLSTHVEERSPRCIGYGGRRRTRPQPASEENPPPTTSADCHRRLLSKHMSSYLSHPLTQRFVDPRVEAAFGAFKSNTQSCSIWTLVWTLCLGALSVSSTAVVDSFFKVWNAARKHEDESLLAFNAIVYTLVIMIYVIRAQRLLCGGWSEASGGTSSALSKRIWKAFCSKHYVALLLILPIPVEAAFDRPTLMALHLVVSCIFIMAAASLLLWQALIYTFLSCGCYLLYLVLSQVEVLAPGKATLQGGSGGGDEFLGQACCLLLGLLLVCYLARTEEMVLREHFKCQYLGSYLFQRGLLEQALCDRLLVATLPPAVAHYALDKRDAVPPLLSFASMSSIRNIGGGAGGGGVLPPLTTAASAPPAFTSLLPFGAGGGGGGGSTANINAAAAPPPLTAAAAATADGASAAPPASVPPLVPSSSSSSILRHTKTTHPFSIFSPPPAPASPAPTTTDRRGSQHSVDSVGTAGSTGTGGGGPLSLWHSTGAGVASLSHSVLLGRWSSGTATAAAAAAGARHLPRLRNRYQSGGGGGGDGGGSGGPTTGTPTHTPLHPWFYPTQGMVHDVLLRYGNRLPPPLHPFQTIPTSRFVQRKFCTVLVAKAVRAGGSHLLVPPEMLFLALGEFDVAAAHHRLSKVCNTGSTYTACCGLFETWGSARRDALATVAMASDLVAIGEVLGLDLCVGVTSGSVVGTLDPVSHAFYDLVGDVVTAATLMAELGMTGQVFVGDSTYQLLDQKEWTFRIPRVGTHNVTVRLLNGVEETVRAVSNPYATSWWYEQRQEEVVARLALREEEGGMSAGKKKAMKGEGDDDDVESLEEGTLGLGREQDNTHTTAFPFSIATVYDLRKELEETGMQQHERPSLSASPSPSLSPRPWPLVLTTLQDDEQDEKDDVAATGATTTTSRAWWHSCACWQKMRPSQRTENKEEASAFNTWLSVLLLQPRLELESLLLALTVATLIWSINLEAWVAAGFFVLVALQCFLRWRRRPSQESMLIPYLVLGLYCVLITAMMASLAVIDHSVLSVSMLRVMFLLSPVLYLPTAPACGLAVLVYLLLLVNHLVAMLGYGNTSSSKHIAHRPSLQQFIIGRDIWYGLLLAFMLSFHRQTERLALALPRFVYPRLEQLQELAQTFTARTDAVVAKLVPSHLDIGRLLDASRREKVGGYLALRTEAVIVHIDLRSLSKLDGLVSPLQLCAFQKRLLGMLDGAVRLFSASHLWHSCHIYVVACGLNPALTSSGGNGSSNGNTNNTNTNNDPVLQALGLSRFIKVKIHEFNLKNRVSLAVRVGIARGPITLSCAGTERFDATGRPITLAKALALRTRATMVTAEIAAHVQEHAPPEMLKTITFHPVTAGPLGLRGGETLEAVELTLESQLPDHLTAGPRLEDFQVLGLLGSGGYGAVHLAKEVHSGGLFAMKVMFKRRRGVSDLMRVELNVLAQVQHPHVVQFHYCLQTKSRIILVMEYIRGGTLKAILKEPQRPPQSVLRLWMAELVLALGYLHSLNVIHRDIKPDNCMVGENGHLKLTDFGLAKVLRRHDGGGGGVGGETGGGGRVGDESGGGGADEKLKGESDAAGGVGSGSAASAAHSKASDGLQQLAAAAAWNDSSTSDIVPLMQRLMPQRSYGQASASSLNADDISGGSTCSAFTQPYRVLVVEDEPFTRLITKAMVKSMGFQPVTAPHGKRALEVLRARLRTPHPIELVLLDLGLPVMTGPEVLAEMQADVALRSIPVVVLSVDDRTADIAACMEMGAKDYFIKPIRMDMAPSLLKFARDRRREQASAVVENRLSEGDEEQEEEEEEEEEEERKKKKSTAAGGGGGGGGKKEKGKNHNDKTSTAAAAAAKENEKDKDVNSVDIMWEGVAASVGVGAAAGGGGGGGGGGGDIINNNNNNLDDDVPMPTREHYSLVGTPYYMSIEMLNRQKYGSAVDYWALGVMLFECFARTPPFTGETPEAVFASIRARQIPWHKLRKTAKEVDAVQLEHLIRGLLHPDQYQRLGSGPGKVEEIKGHPFFAGIDWERISTCEVGYRPAPRLFPVAQQQQGQKVPVLDGDDDKQSSLVVSEKGGEGSIGTYSLDEEGAGGEEKKKTTSELPALLGTTTASASASVASESVSVALSKDIEGESRATLAPAIAAPQQEGAEIKKEAPVKVDAPLSSVPAASTMKTHKPTANTTATSKSSSNNALHALSRAFSHHKPYSTTATSASKKTPSKHKKKRSSGAAGGSNSSISLSSASAYGGGGGGRSGRSSSGSSSTSRYHRKRHPSSSSSFDRDRWVAMMMAEEEGAAAAGGGGGSGSGIGGGRAGASMASAASLRLSSNRSILKKKRTDPVKSVVMHQQQQQQQQQPQQPQAAVPSSSQRAAPKSSRRFDSSGGWGEIEGEMMRR